MFGVVISQEGLVQTAAFFTFHHIYFFAVARYFAQRISSGVVHRCGTGHGAWIKGLHLIGAETVFLKPNGQVHHVFVTGARVRSNEIRHQELLFASLSTELIEHAFESIVGTDAGLHHF